jgi:hypothetical protein
MQMLCCTSLLSSGLSHYQLLFSLPSDNPLLQWSIVASVSVSPPSCLQVLQMVHLHQQHQSGFFLPTATFLPPGSGMAVYRGIPLNTARIQISNQNLLLPLVQTVLNGIPRYK